MKLLVFLLFVFACSVNSLPFVEQRIDEFSYRLPNHTFPVHYDVNLRTSIHEADFHFTGNVNILVNVVEETDSIILHSNNNFINEVTLSSGGSSIPITIEIDVTFQQIRILPAITLPANTEYNIYIDFDGFLRTDQSGFYRSSYTNDDGETVWLATTQFEPTDARSAFPCFDEPAHRATFDITINHHSSYSAVSNMPIEAIGGGEEGYVVTYFERTPIMPTYLLAFIVSDFAYNGNDGILDQTRQRVYAQPNRIDETDYALQSAIDILEAQEAYIGFTYNLPKLDQAAIPDFSAGAMENWGLVTYRTQYLLFTEGQANEEAYRRTIATIIAHEYAHQFFGNHVTPAWWTYLWLNEGFATLYEFLVTDIVFPEMRLRERMAIDSVQYVFYRDSIATSRPMSYYVETPNAINNIFDSIAYDKSGSVLRMISYALEETTFVKGLAYYLKDRGFSTATPDDLSRNIQIAVTEDGTLPSDVTVSEVMDSWTTQSGFPLVTVARDYVTGEISLTQERYLRSGTGAAQSWWIPYNFASSNRRNFDNTSPIGWIPQGTETVDVVSTDDITWSSEDWVLFNVQQTGYYRVNYDDTNWLLLAAELQEGDFEDIAPVNRAQLLDDSSRLADSGHLEHAIANQISAYLVRETDYIVLLTTSRRFNFLNTILAGQSYHNDFKRYALSLIENAFNKYGTEELKSDSHSDKEARSILMKLACELGSATCLEKSVEKFNSFIQSGTPITPELKETVLCHGLRQSSVESFMYVFELMQKSDNNAERNAYINGLACVESADLLTSLLYAVYAGSNEDVKFLGGERLSVIKAVAKSSMVGLEVTLDFINKNLKEFVGADQKTLKKAMVDISEIIATPALFEKFTNILENMTETNELKQSAEDNMDWIARNGLKYQQAMNKYL